MVVVVVVCAAAGGERKERGLVDGAYVGAGERMGGERRAHHPAIILISAGSRERERGI